MPEENILMSAFIEPETTDDNDFIIMLVDGVNAKVKKSDLLAAVTQILDTKVEKTKDLYFPISGNAGELSAGLNWTQSTDDYSLKVKTLNSDDDTQLQLTLSDNYTDSFAIISIIRDNDGNIISQKTLAIFQQDAVTFPFLAGTGNRFVTANPEGVLSATNVAP